MTRRPVGVWLICGYMAITTLSALLSIGYAFMSDNPDVQWGRAYYQSLSLPQLSYLVLSAIVALSAAVSLFMLSRAAAWLFSAVLVLGIGNATWQLTSGWLSREATDMVGAPTVYLSLAVGLAITAGTAAYVWRLRVRRVLT